MYKQYTTEHKTEIGLMRIERTFKAKGLQMYGLDSILVSCAGKVAELPKSMWQTDTTIIKKMVAIFKPQLDALQIDNAVRSMHGGLIGE